MGYANSEFSSMISYKIPQFAAIGLLPKKMNNESVMKKNVYPT